MVWINTPTNAVGRYLLAPVGVLPGWLSNTIISAISTVFLLTLFKHTSHQGAIGRVREKIKADMLVLKLFKDSMVVIFQAQCRIFKGILLLLVYAVKPMLVMIGPVCLLLAQMGLWYQFRPLQPGEETILTMNLNDDITLPWPRVSIEPMSAAEVVIGPSRILSRREICWKIKAHTVGYHRIVFQVDGHEIGKALAIGDGFMRVSAKRPGWHWTDIFSYPLERPFPPGSIVQSIRIDYPERISRTSGNDGWMVYFFAVSLVFAMIFKPILKVRL